MQKYILTFFISMLSFGVFAQEKKASVTVTAKSNNADELSFYPNPSSSGRIYINSKSDSEKDVVIYNVLGRPVLQTNTVSREINISSLSPGIYLVRLKDGEISETRKLIVK